MFGFKKPPASKASKVSSANNPFDSDDEVNPKADTLQSKRSASEPNLNVPGSNIDEYKNGFRQSGGLENQSVQELENYAVYKAEETTKTVDKCLKIAEDIRKDATMTLDMLHAQGEQITRTHQMAADMDRDLTKGEKLLNSLGGMFSKPWKPKKTRDITGPLITSDNPGKKNEHHKKRRDELLGSKQTARSAPATPPPEPKSAMQKVQIEKEKQEDALSDLSNILGDLKNMAVDMGGELERQNKALDHLGADVDELNSRVKGANQRTRRLLGK